MSKTKIKNHYYHKRTHYLIESEFRKFYFFLLKKITDWCPDYIKVAFYKNYCMTVFLVVRMVITSHVDVIIIII